MHAIPTGGLSFHSDSSLYQKLVSSTPQNKTYWTDKCSGEPTDFCNGFVKYLLNFLFAQIILDC